MLLQSVGTMLGPALFGLPLRALWAWLALRQSHGVLDHVGVELPFDPAHLLAPGFGGARFHDDHHRYFTVNYASVFPWIDILFGTARRARPKAA